jgi:hypothetical protein
MQAPCLLLPSSHLAAACSLLAALRLVSCEGCDWAESLYLLLGLPGLLLSLLDATLYSR